ncbi:MAG: hypothetical protein N0C81_04790 [Candidatus Thiodiazotropha lotti]|uniref:Uncharacterized protein n=1 Tax=Candidatus Thiodiazotropha lotti TaxID=2792787 RepID=A0A9E4K6D8_9GAMM|nr:hypothetical protein [Candidatus Thiodiazotropha lotti]ODC01883.1 hypothetical protein A3197_05395 [Candidatus Thiodiazotropha endoloripes]MCG7923494.1 hypothetical protein [Candidatus Thiodiazotropha lotti]MCG7931212.1 hypothetical protein [Candidatus Thiodiazotropha lotti]MCG7939713.1 hypothetical protein [Candidatus Thiodiazotropha lotti]
MKNVTKLAKALTIFGLSWCAVGILLIVTSNIQIHFGIDQFQLLDQKQLKNGAFTALLLFPGLGLYLAGRTLLKKQESDARP